MATMNSSKNMLSTSYILNYIIRNQYFVRVQSILAATPKRSSLAEY